MTGGTGVLHPFRPPDSHSVSSFFLPSSALLLAGKSIRICDSVIGQIQDLARTLIKEAEQVAQRLQVSNRGTVLKAKKPQVKMWCDSAVCNALVLQVKTNEAERGQDGEHSVRLGVGRLCMKGHAP